MFYILGSAVGPHPYPKIVRFFQSIIGNEIKHQCLEKENRLPDYILACIGGGSNAIGAFHAFMDNPEVNLIGIEAAGEGIESGKTAASLAKGKKMILHGKRQYVLCDKDGNVLSSYSIRTSGRPYALRVSADRTALSKDRATAHLTVEVIDENGVVVKLGDNDITCTIEGPARLLGLEGSNNSDMSDYTDNRHRAYHGRLLAYIQTTGTEGAVRVKFTSPLLQGTEIALDVE